MANYLGALIGAAIDRRDGDSGIKGAIVGTVAEKAVRMTLPIVATFALGWAVKRAATKTWNSLRRPDAP